jgi:hypothetical protein
MQSFVWVGLAVTTGACVTGFTRIVRGARAEMKARRRKQTIARWVRSEIAAKNQTRSQSTHRLFSS